MAKTSPPTIDRLIQQGAWSEARARIEQELRREPDNHWLLTQLGVTYYEQRRYRDALVPLLDSLKIVPDCPLTLWNVAGTLDALGKSEIAISIYTWLIRSKKSADDDPCWESQEWADALKTDCVYRVGVCFQHMKRRDSAEQFFRQYINLILAGMNGTYPVEDAAKRIRELQGNGRQRLEKAEKEVRNAIKSTLQDAGILSAQGRQRALPKLSLPDLLAT